MFTLTREIPDNPLHRATLKCQAKKIMRDWKHNLKIKYKRDLAKCSSDIGAVRSTKPATCKTLAQYHRF